MTARRILIVDDDDLLRDGLKEQLSLYEEFEVVEAPTATRGVQATCLAGAWAWYVFDDGRATNEDLDDAAEFYLSLVDGDLLAEVFFFGFETDYVSDCFAASA